MAIGGGGFRGDTCHSPFLIQKISKFPREKKDSQRFAKESLRAIVAKACTMESLVTGYLRSVQYTEGTSSYIPPAVLPIGYVEPSLITGLAFTMSS